MTRRPQKPFRPEDELQVTLAGARRPDAAPRRRWPFIAQRALLARSLMLYRYIDLAGVPPGRRPAAVRARIRAWSPFAQSDCKVLWFDQGAGVFAWDAERMRQRLAAMPAGQARHLALVPESAHIAAPAIDGARLVRGIDGFEGQVWRDGHLQSSRSWSQRPEAADWLNFLRGAGIAPDAGRDAADALVDPVPWSALPIAKMSAPDALRNRSGAVEAIALYAGSLALMLATAVVTRDYWDIARRTGGLKEELTRREQAAGANRSARDRALATRLQVENLTSALARADVLKIQDQLLTRLPQAGTEVQELSFDGSELRVVLKAPANIAREVVVKDLEQGHQFTDVHEAREGPAGTIALVMKVPPPALAVRIPAPHPPQPAPQ